MILNPLLWLLQQNRWQNLNYSKSFSFYFNNEIIILKHLSCNRRCQFLLLLMLTGLTMPYLHCNHFCDFSISPVSLHETHFLVWRLWYHVKNQFTLILHTIPKQQIQMQHSVMNKRQMMKSGGGGEGKDASTSQWGKSERGLLLGILFHYLIFLYLNFPSIHNKIAEL